MEDLKDLRAMLNRLAKRLETDVRKLDARVDKLMKLPDIIELEHLVKTLAWAMDLGDKDRWLSIWSDDIHYTVPQYNIDLRGKKALAEFAEVSIFNREKRRFSSITNILAEVTGDTATARDYYMHYGYPINAESGEPSLERAFSEGMHYYKFRKADGIWKITSMEVYVHRRQEEGETR